MKKSFLKLESSFFALFNYFPHNRAAKPVIVLCDLGAVLVQLLWKEWNLCS